MLTWVSRLISRIFPEDPNPGCGYLGLRLPDGHPFHKGGCFKHDDAFADANANGLNSKKTLNQVDWELFCDWYKTASEAPTDAERCQLASEICRYWPLARLGGKVLWDGRK